MKQEKVNEFISKSLEHGRPNMHSVIDELKKYKKFTNDEIFEIFNSLFSRQGLLVTPNNLSELISFIGQIRKPKTIIDICCGTGKILNYFKDSQTKTGVDINFDIIQLAKFINPEIEFTVANSLEYDFKNAHYDLVIGSLPFGVRTKDKKSLEIELIKIGLSVLSINGVAIFIVPEGLLASQSSNDFRQHIISNYALDMVISLPQSVFYPYTGVKTSILVIRNGKPNNDIFMPLFEDNSRDIATNFQNHNGSFYLPLSKLENRFDRNYYSSVEIIEEKLRGKEVKKLSEIAQIINGRFIDKDSYKKSGRYLVYNRKDKNGNEYFVDNIKDEHCILKPNDIVIPLVISNKKIHVHKAEHSETVIPENYAIIRSAQNNYINTYLQTKDGIDFLWQQASRHAVGSVVSILSFSVLANLEIPILPLSELNFVSEEWLASASNEKLLNLETKLKGLVTNYEPESIHLKLLNEILVVVTSQEKISRRIENKIDIALTALQKLNSEITTIKHNKREDEEKISRIYFEIDEKLRLLTNEQEKEVSFYQNEIKKWLDDWQLLHTSSSNFLTSAELIFDHLPDSQDTDYSPFIIQYCRALENEILKKLFEAYHDYLLKNKIDRKKLVLVDITNDKTQVFAKFIDRDKRDYTLGNMNTIMNFLKEGGNTLRESPLLQNFRCFTLTYFEDKVLQKEFLESINNITTNYRNKSAHPYILTLETAKECKKLIRRILTEFLQNYKH